VSRFLLWVVDADVRKRIFLRTQARGGRSYLELDRNKKTIYGGSSSDSRVKQLGILDTSQEFLRWFLAKQEV
jgi:hypothetical protein